MVLFKDWDVDEVSLALLKTSVVHRDRADDSRPLIFDELYHLLVVWKFVLADLKLSKSSAQLGSPEMLYLHRKLVNEIKQPSSDRAKRPRVVRKRADKAIDHIQPVFIQKD